VKNRKGELWEEIRTMDWFWIEKRENRYFSSCWLTCVDAIRILQGRQPVPRTCREVEDIACFVPVSKEVIKLLARALEKLKGSI